MLCKKADQILEGEGAGRKLSYNNNLIPVKCGVYTMPQFSAQKEKKVTEYTHIIWQV